MVRKLAYVCSVCKIWQLGGNGYGCWYSFRSSSGAVGVHRRDYFFDEVKSKVNIEAVDNVVYLYSRIAEGEMRYAEMMDILQKSHKELKM